MAAKKQIVGRAKPRGGSRGRTEGENRRLWLMYPPRLIQTPLIWELGHRFELVTNVRQASVNDEIGVVCLEVTGSRDRIKSAIKWLERKGVSVEPVEINVIES